MTRVHLFPHALSAIFVAVALSLLTTGCSDFDRTPADIHKDLVPKIAADILKTGASPRLRGQPENYLSRLSPVGSVRWDQSPLPGSASSEATITFYRMPENTPILSIGFNLSDDQKTYLFATATFPK